MLGNHLRRGLIKLILHQAICAAAILIPSAHADDTGAAEALKQITATANQICQSAPLEQSAEGLTLSGEAKAKLSGVASKLADLGITGGADYKSGRSAGVLQKDLITAIQSSNNCKLEVFKALERDLLHQNRSDAGGSPPASNRVIDAFFSRNGMPKIGSDISDDIRSGTFGAPRSISTQAGESFLEVRPRDLHSDVPAAGLVSALDTRNGKVVRIHMQYQVFSLRPGDALSQLYDWCDKANHENMDFFTRLLLKGPDRLSAGQVFRNISLPDNNGTRSIRNPGAFAADGFDVWVYSIEGTDTYYGDSRASCLPQVLIK